KPTSPRELLRQVRNEVLEPRLRADARRALGVLRDQRRVREPQLDPGGERLREELEVALGARRGAAEAIEAAQEQRRVADAVEVQEERRLNDRALGAAACDA